MTQSNEPTIEYKNAIIARFMGYKRVEVGYSGTEEETEWQRNNEEWINKVGITLVGHYFVNVPNDEWIPCDDIHYHDSWDALMPVVEKIETIENKRFGVCIDVLDTMIMDYKVPHDIGEKIVVQTDIYPDNGDTKISITHAAVYQFITWLNQQSK